MTRQELFDALNAMRPHATNIVGINALFDSEEFNPPPVYRIEYECHVAAAGQAMAFQLHRLWERLVDEGLE